jgi:hypothetical protein
MRGCPMGEVEECRRQAEECFRRHQTVDRFSKPYWLALSQQWARLADEAEAAPPSLPPPLAPRLDNLRDVLEEALSERALALSAARVAEPRSRQ